MDERITQWAQTPEAQPYMQQAMANLGISGAGSSMGVPGMGGMGYDPYAIYLQQMIDANQQNPAFQKSLLGYYIDYTNPMNQQAPIVDENKLNTALSLLSSEDENLKGMGQALLAEAYPQLAGSGYGMSAQPTTYEDLQRQQAETVLSAPEGMKRGDFDWYNYLQSASDEEVGQYEDAKKKWKRALWYSPKDFFDTDYWGGTGFYNPFDASSWSAERAARAKMGYF